MHPADRLDQPVRRGVLDHEPDGAGRHRPPQVTGPTEGGEDDHPGRRVRGHDRRRGGHAVAARLVRAELDVHQDHVRLHALDQLHGRDAATGLADHLEIRLQFEQCGQRLADQRLVVDQHDADHRPGPGRSGGVPPGIDTAFAAAATAVVAAETRAVTRVPAPGSACTSSAPPAAATRAASPCRPEPASLRTARPVVDHLTASSVTEMVQVCARCAGRRWSPPRGPRSRTVRWSRSVSAGRAAGTAASMPAASSTDRRRPARWRPGPRGSPTPWPDVGQGLPGDLLTSAICAWPRRVGVDQPRRQLGLDRDRGQRVPQDVVQVAADPFPLGDTARVATRCSRGSARLPTRPASIPLPWPALWPARSGRYRPAVQAGPRRAAMIISSHAPADDHRPGAAATGSGRRS